MPPHNGDTPASAVSANPLQQEETEEKELEEGVKEEGAKEATQEDASENVQGVDTVASENSTVVVSVGEAKDASVPEQAAPVTVTKKTVDELHQHVILIRALENQNFELLTRLEALESMIVPTEQEIEAAPSSSMLAASMKNMMSVMS